MDERIIYLYEPPGFLALFVPDSFASYLAHINVTPQMRGKQGIDAGKRAIEWTWSNTEKRRIWGAISADNVRAIRYAKLCGMKVFGRNEKSFMKNGKLTDQVLLGVSRG
jgi:RimJ/RimL family protein N-acetyltransferase